MLRSIAGPRAEPGTGAEAALVPSGRGLVEAEPGEDIAFVSPERVWQFLRRQRRILIAAVAISMLLAGAFVVLSPPKYRSMARLLIDPRGLQILKNEITRTSDSADSNLLDVENQRYVILSRNILAATVKRGHLEENPLFGGAPPGLLGRLFAFFGRAPAKQDLEDKAIAKLADSIDVVRGERAYIIDITVTTRNPKVSADLANLIAKVYLEQEQESRVQTAKRASDALNGRASELGHEVQQAEEELETFRLRNNLAFGASGQLLGDQQVADLNTQLAMAKARAAAAQARVDLLEKAKGSKFDPSQLPEAMQSPVITALRGQYAQLVQQEASYATQFGPRHPALVQVRNQLQDVRNLISAELTRIAQSARTDLTRAKASEATLEHSIQQMRQTLGDKAVALAHMHELERTAEAKKSIYQSVLTRQKELEEQQGLDTSNTRIISEAVPATKTSGPPAVIVLVGAMIFGFGAGAGIGYVREAMGRSEMTPEDLEQRFEAPFLGYFNYPSPSAAHGATYPPARGRDGAIASLIHLAGDETGPRILGLVGLHGRDMRLPLLAELAATAQQEDLSLGLIECDFNPTDPMALAAPDREPQPQAEEAERPPVITPLADLLIDDPGPLTLRRLRGTLADYADGRDLVLLNLPPVLDSGMPPGLLDALDATVLVIAANDVEARKIERLAGFLGKARTPLAGFILTGVRRD